MRRFASLMLQTSRFSMYESERSHLVRPRRVLVLARALVELADRLGGQLRRNLTRGVGHPFVGHEEELLVLDQREVVLVVGPLHAHICLGSVADLHVRPGEMTGHDERHPSQRMK